MKASEKKMIAILIAITIVVIIIAIVIGNSGNKSKEETTTTEQEETTQVLEDGTLLNNSDKLHETKKLEGMEITDIQLTENEEETLLIGTITNTSNTEQGGYVASIKMIDKQGNEIKTLDAYIGKLKPEKSMQFSTSATFDSSNVYDFTMIKK